MKILLLTPEPIDDALLRSAVGDQLDGAEVLVVSPASSQSKLAFWMGAVDREIREADAAEEETVERLEEAGVDAAGQVGDSDPGLALQDALATFPADRIVIALHAEGDRDYREDTTLSDAEARTGIPVTWLEVGRS